MDSSPSTFIIFDIRNNGFKPEKEQIFKKITCKFSVTRRGYKEYVIETYLTNLQSTFFFMILANFQVNSFS